MGDYMPVGENGSTPFTLTVGATAVVGGQLVDTATNDTVLPALGVLRPVGVALHDAVVGQRVTIFPIPGVLHETVIKTGSVLAAGNPVIAATTAGQVDTVALTTAAAAGTLLGVVIRGGTGSASVVVKARWIGA